MFSATWPKEVHSLAADFQVDPVHLNVGSLEFSQNHLNDFDSRSSLIEEVEEDPFDDATFIFDVSTENTDFIEDMEENFSIKHLSDAEFFVPVEGKFMFPNLNVYNCRRLCISLPICPFKANKPKWAFFVIDTGAPKTRISIDVMQKFGLDIESSSSSKKTPKHKFYIMNRAFCLEIGPHNTEDHKHVSLLGLDFFAMFDKVNIEIKMQHLLFSVCFDKAFDENKASNNPPKTKPLEEKKKKNWLRRFF